MGNNSSPDYRLRCLSLRSSHDILEVLRKVGVDPYGIEAMLPKMTNLNILIEGVECKIANIIKQEMLSVGGDAAVSRYAVSCGVAATDVVIMGTVKQVQRFAEKIAIQPFKLGYLANAVKEAVSNRAKDLFVLRTCRREMVIGDRSLVMGVINVTPDSFSDGGKFPSPAAAIEHGLKMADEGADFIDIGGESTRPGAKPVSPREELKRIIPVVKGLSGRIDVPLSVDTTKAEVAKAALDQGAEIINDISALRFDDSMPKVIAENRAAVILMHMRGTPRTMQEGDLSYSSLCGEIIHFLRQQMDRAVQSGVPPEQMMVDPGIGFGKTPGDNMKLLKHLSEFKVLGRPIVSGVSRKSFIGKVLGGEPMERGEGTAAAVVVSIMNGSNVVRVHDVGAIKKVVAMTDAIIAS